MVDQMGSAGFAIDQVGSLFGANLNQQQAFQAVTDNIIDGGAINLFSGLALGRLFGGLGGNSLAGGLGGTAGQIVVRGSAAGVAVSGALAGGFLVGSFAKCEAIALATN
jgi:hypothetical protein